VGNIIGTTHFARWEGYCFARGASTHFAYDALNRLTRRWYNGSSLTSATTHNSPALPSGVGATDEANFYYDSQSLPSGAPSFSRGSSIGKQVGVMYGSGSSTDYFGYDALGRAVVKIQQTGTTNYQMTAAYNLTGVMTSTVYPSGHNVTYTYDNAGRTTSVSGSLGDSTTRTYSNEIVYSPLGGMAKEKFGTTTPVYNKLFYNLRGQLSEIRASTSYTGPADTNWNRGAIINSYSDQSPDIINGAYFLFERTTRGPWTGTFRHR
jgi:YD repeat-containing protein